MDVTLDQMIIDSTFNLKSDIVELMDTYRIEELGSLDFLDDEFLDIGADCDVTASSKYDTEKEMEAAFSKGNENETDAPMPKKETCDEKKRFKKLSENELKDLENSRQSKSTKRNTKWGVKTFQAWSVEADSEATDFYNISPECLNAKLRRFYAEAAPAKCNTVTEPNTSTEYHRNSFKNIRAAINRHLNDIGRDIDIVRDKTFKTANQLLDGKLKSNVEKGLSRPTQHKAIIPPSDLQKICTYLHSVDNSITLRYRVWYNLAMQFVSRGIEFHQQLTPQSFKFDTDEEGFEYATIRHETKQKNHQGGIENTEPYSDKRMYGTGKNTCPVKALKFLLEKTDPKAEFLFNHCTKSALQCPEKETFWYTNKAVKPYQFSRFMADISRNAGCSQRYTAHCIRATDIQNMSDAGYETRHIMLMSGHKNERSVSSYSRGCSTKQKRKISATISSISTGTGDRFTNVRKS